MYDYLLVGAGLFNGVFAYEAGKIGKKCLVLERRDHIGGNCYTYIEDEIVIHKYGAHIFRTCDRKIWDYMNQFAEFNHFVNSPIAIYHNELYNLPFNMNTFSKMWGIKTPEEARNIIKQQNKEIVGEAKNLEEHAIKLVGKDIYTKLIKEYTEKQWGRPCKELPASIMRRIPLRFTYDNNYFIDPYQGIPKGGYTNILNSMFKNCDIEYNVDFNLNREKYRNKTQKVVYTGAIDEYFDYVYGTLEYRGLFFEIEKLKIDNYQGVAVVNYTDKDTPYTRCIEHKHFEFGEQPITIISKEYPISWSVGKEPYYPINDEKNDFIYSKYRELGKQEKNVFFGGRLGEYKYYDMQDTIKSALKLANSIL